MPGHVRLPRGTAVEELQGYDEGAWWVQDLAASLPGRLLGDGSNKRALDLCAAPGGKTMQLSAAGFTVTALDNSARRMDRLMANLERTQLNADRVTADVMEWEPSGTYDAILLDAPCSATGTMRRHPDVLQRIDIKQINNLAALQCAMLRSRGGLGQTRRHAGLCHLFAGAAGRRGAGGVVSVQTSRFFVPPRDRR